MKNESTFNHNYRFKTYTMPQIERVPKEENLNKVKIELETGTIVNTNLESVKISVNIKNEMNLIVPSIQGHKEIIPIIKFNLTNADEILPKFLQNDKPSHNIKINNDITIPEELKKKEEFNNIEIPTNNSNYNFEINKNYSISTINNNNGGSIVKEKFKQKKRKKECINNMNDCDIRTGRWTKDEHRKFIEAICKFGNEWKKVQQYIKTRSSTQSRSHAQKFFLRLKKKFNLSNKDSETSIAELSKFPEDLIINYIRECTNTNTIINVEEKNRLINVLVNFANFNKKTKRKKIKINENRDESIVKSLNNDNYYTEHNVHFKNEFLSEDDNNAGNDFNNLSEENEEECENESLTNRKIFKILKVPKINDELSLINHKFIRNKTLPRNNKESINIKNEDDCVSNCNIVGKSFNIKNENLAKNLNLPVNNLINNKSQSELIKNLLSNTNPHNNNNGIDAKSQPDSNNKQNYNYINIMTINVCQPNGANNNKVPTISQNQIPMSALLNNLNGGNNGNINLNNQILQHLIKQNAMNLQNNNNNNIPNNSNLTNINNNNNNMSNISTLNNTNNHFSSFNSNNNLINSNQNDSTEYSNNMKNNTNQAFNNNILLNNNNVNNFKNLKNISFNNNSNNNNTNNISNNNTISFNNSNGVYDEMKNYYNKNTNQLYLNNNNNNSIIINNNCDNNPNNIFDKNLQNNLNSAKNQANDNSKSAQINSLHEFLMHNNLQQANNQQLANNSNNSKNINQTKQRNPMVKHEILNKNLIKPSYNTNMFYYDLTNNDKKEDEDNDFANPFNLNFITNETVEKKEEDVEDDFWYSNK